MHAAPACRPCRWPWPRRSPRPAPPAARTPRLGSPAAPASPDRLLPHREPDTRAARGPRSGTESLNRVLQAQCATRQGQGPGARLTRRPQRPETHRRRRATRPDFHACTASPAGTWRLTGKQTDFARYELVFTPARRPPQGTPRLTGKQTGFARYELVFTPARRPPQGTPRLSRKCREGRRRLGLHGQPAWMGSRVT